MEFTGGSDRLAVFAVPSDLVLLVVLDEEPVGDYVFTIYNYPLISGVKRPANTITVVSSPSPNIVNDHVVIVDDQTIGTLTRRSAADAKEHVLDQSGIDRVAAYANRQ
jgi:hypothetical protein